MVRLSYVVSFITSIESRIRTAATQDNALFKGLDAECERLRIFDLDMPSKSEPAPEIKTNAKAYWPTRCSHGGQS